MSQEKQNPAGDGGPHAGLNDDRGGQLRSPQLDSLGQDYTQAELALLYTRAGFPVSPMRIIRHNAKYLEKPDTPNGIKDATLDEAPLCDWAERFPGALYAMPTGPTTGFCVLRFHMPEAEQAAALLLRELDLESLHDLSDVVVKGAYNTIDLYFRQPAGTAVLGRSGDIGKGIETRGDRASIILPGNRLPDGRAYRHAGQSSDLLDAAEPTRALFYRLMFNRRERRDIAGDSALVTAIQDSEPAEWRGLYERSGGHRRQGDAA